MSIILCYYAVNTFSPHMVISNKCTSTFLENKIFFISPCEQGLYLWIKITHTKSIRVNIICSCQSQPRITFIPTIPFAQCADTTQQGGSVSQPIDWAIDQQIGIINWGIIHPASPMSFPLLHFHYDSFWRQCTEGEMGRDQHLPLISILIKRPSDNDQSKQSA